MSIQYVPAHARVVTNVAAPYNLTGSNNVLQIKVDGGSTQTVTLTTGAAQTAANIVTDCGVLTGVTPAVVTVNGQDFVSFTTTTTNGAASTIEVLAPANNVNATFGLTATTVNGGQRITTVLEMAATKQQIINATESALVQVGWYTISGSGTTNLLMQSSMTPQGLRYRLRVRDNGSNNTSFSIENVAGTRQGTNNTNGTGLLWPNNRTYRIVASKYQFFIFEDNATSVNSNSASFRSTVFCGVPWIPSNLVGTIYESIWMITNASSDGSSSQRGSLREVLGARNNVGGNGNLTVICNNNIWESQGNSGMNGIGMPSLITLWQGTRIQRQLYTWYRWHDDTEFMVDPLIAWGLTAQTDEAKIRGQLWESYIAVGGPYQPNHTFTLDGRTFLPMTINNYGTNENARGALMTAIS
jgi:hypothetical protein